VLSNREHAQLRHLGLGLRGADDELDTAKKIWTGRGKENECETREVERVEKGREDTVEKERVTRVFYER
jgi:hypothetical protein